MRDYQDQKADVILKYNAEEARNLKAYGELPDHGKLKKYNVTLLPPANDVWGKVIFSQASVCPQGGVWQTPLIGIHPPWADTPRNRKRAVRILLECILVKCDFHVSVQDLVKIITLVPAYKE